MSARPLAFPLLVSFVVAVPAYAEKPAEDKPAGENSAQFSGPQVGEKLTALKVRLLAGDKAGEELDLVEQAAGKPLVLLFVHEVNRPSIGLARTILTHAAQHKADGLHAALVFLSDDATKTEEFVKRAAHALPQNVPVGVSTDGAEGPGAYGLNRKVTVTALVAKGNTVTANFALVQPSLQADGPKIAEAIAAAGGFEPATLADLEKIAQPVRRGK
jgi:hypothetical protein